jgi:hypothetical protein
MGIPAHSLRLVSSGLLPGGEVWNTGLWVSPVDGIASFDDLVLAMAVPQSAFNTMWNVLKARWSAGVKAKTLFGYYYDGGEFGDSATFSAELPLDENEGTGTPVMPNQCAVVASLRTGRSGQSFRGRMYLPLLKSGLGLNSEMDTFEPQAVSDAVATCVSAINAGPGPVAVVSVTQTVATPVTAVEVDSIIDTQRRRRNKLLPSTLAISVVT